MASIRGRRFLAVGDIHGAFKAFLQVLDRSDYDPKQDFLIFMGDLVDGWPDSFQIVEFIRHLPKDSYRVIKGNHDLWLEQVLEAVLEGVIDPYQERMMWMFNQEWWKYGGQATFNSYPWDDKVMLKAHYELISSFLIKLNIEDINYTFIHGGWDKKQGLDATFKNDPEKILWDREVWHAAVMNQWYAKKKKSQKIKSRDSRYEFIFVGHSPVAYYKKHFTASANNQPMKCGNMINLDTGAGFDGKLTIMDIEDKQFWQSDPVPSLYPEFAGRGVYNKLVTDVEH